jgi:cation:H+ antiporter
VLAVTFIALGTSLPELVTAISALIKGHAAVSVGNILGANIMNLLLVIGIPAAITGIVPSASAMWIDLPAAMFAMAILTLPMIIFKKGNRVQGALLIVGYAVYCITQF